MAEKIDEEKAKALQQKYVEYQMMEQQFKQMQEQLEKFDQQASEISAISRQLDELKGCRKESDTLVPVANGIFVKGRIIDTDEVVVNVGAGVAVKKTVDETKTLLQSQAAEIENYRMQVAAQIEMMHKKKAELEKELSAMVE